MKKLRRLAQASRAGRAAALAGKAERFAASAALPPDAHYRQAQRDARQPPAGDFARRWTGHDDALGRAFTIAIMPPNTGARRMAVWFIIAVFRCYRRRPTDTQRMISLGRSAASFRRRRAAGGFITTARRR